MKGLDIEPESSSSDELLLGEKRVKVVLKYRRHRKTMNSRSGKERSHSSFDLVECSGKEDVRVRPEHRG